MSDKSCSVKSSVCVCHTKKSNLSRVNVCVSLGHQEKEVTITLPNGETTVATVRIWNETVSNLTLMALGSSAPEILLSVIEVHTQYTQTLCSGCVYTSFYVSPPLLSTFYFHQIYVILLKGFLPISVYLLQKTVSNQNA